MPQILRPDGTLQTDFWRVSGTGSAVLHPAINEVDPDDATSIRCPNPGGGGLHWAEQTARFSLPPADEPARRTSHSVFIRLWRRPDAEWTASFKLTLKGGSYEHDFYGTAPPDPTALQFTVPEAQARDFDDYSAMEVWIERSYAASGFYVSWLAVTIPYPAFAHLDQSNGGLIVAAPSSGHYLELAGGGALRIAGEETDGALTLGGGGGYVVKL